MTPTVPINPYGKSKLYAEHAIRDYARANPNFKAAILRYFNVFGSDPEKRVGEMPRAELRAHGKISGACFDAALKNIDRLTVIGTKLCPTIRLINKEVIIKVMQCLKISFIVFLIVSESSSSISRHGVEFPQNINVFGS